MIVVLSWIDGGSVVYDIICFVFDLVNEFKNKYLGIIMFYCYIWDL